MLTGQYSELTKQKQQLDEQILFSKNQTEQAQQKIFDLEQVLNKKSTEFDLLELRLADRNEEITRLIQQVKHAQQNLEHYRDSIREQHIDEKKQFEIQINKLEQQLHHHQKQCQQLENLASAQQKENDLLKSSNAILDQQVAKLNQQIQNEQIKFSLNKQNTDTRE